VKDKGSIAITITLPLVLDRALQAFADQKHCGNKSAAIRELLYKEAGVPAKLRMNEKKDTDSVTKARIVPSNTALAKRSAKDKASSRLPSQERKLEKPALRGLPPRSACCQANGSLLRQVSVSSLTRGSRRGA
jgi:hypothetical protein